MKKLSALILALSLAVTLVACSANANTGTPESEGAEQTAATVEEGGKPNAETTENAEEVGPAVQQTTAVGEDQQRKDTSTGAGSLVVYLSHTNTTATVAEHIASAIGADVYEIIPTNAYPSDYNAHLAVAQQELNDDARPAIQSPAPNLEDYDTIFLGYPIWWGYAPRPVATFLEGHDLSGKTIAPFCTSGSSGMGQSAEEIAALAAGAEVVTGLSITSSTAGSADSLVLEWLTDLGLLQE